MSCVILYLSILAIYFSQIITVYQDKLNEPYQTCTLVQMENNFYGIFITSRQHPDTNPQRRFIGLCDVNSLTTWRPCPLWLQDNKCQPGACHVYNSTCSLHEIMHQPGCDCNRTFEGHELDPIPDFPTCIMGGKCLNSNCSIVSRRKVKRDAMMYECVPTGMGQSGPFALVWRRARDVHNFINEPIVLRKQCQIQSFYITEQPYCCFLNPHYYYEQKKSDLTQSDFIWESKANEALRRILRAFLLKRQSAEVTTVEVLEDDDDDENENDDLDEDVAIEEDTDQTERITSTEGLEKEELLKAQQADMKIDRNITENVGEVEPKSGKLNRGSVVIMSKYLSVILVWLLLITRV